MSADPNKDASKPVELSDEQLEKIAGGDGSVDPIDGIFGFLVRPGPDLPATVLND